VGSWGVDGGDGEKWPKSGALTGRQREKDRSGNVAMGTGVAVTVMIRAVDATEQNVGGTHRGQEGDQD